MPLIFRHAIISIFRTMREQIEQLKQTRRELARRHQEIKDAIEGIDKAVSVLQGMNGLSVVPVTQIDGTTVSGSLEIDEQSVGGNANASDVKSEFPKTKSFKEKILWAIRKQGRFCHKSEIQALIEKYQEVRSQTVSFTLSQSFKKGILARVKFNNAFHMIAYGLPDMVTNELGGRLTYSDLKYRPDTKNLPAFKHANLNTIQIERRKHANEVTEAT